MQVPLLSINKPSISFIYNRWNRAYVRSLTKSPHVIDRILFKLSTYKSDKCSESGEVVAKSKTNLYYLLWSSLIHQITGDIVRAHKVNLFAEY